MKKNNDPVEAIDEWTALYQRDIAPLLGAGEKTVAMIEQENHIDHKTAKTLIGRWEAEGVVVKVGKRRTEHGITVDAWRLVTEKVRLAE